MTEIEELSAEILAAKSSPWEPWPIVRAWRSLRPGEISFTMQEWIDLEAIRSPLLRGELPASIEELAESAEILGCAVGGLEGEEAVHLANVLLQTVRKAFAAALPMQHDDAAPAHSDGFGDWLPLLTFLITECGMAPAVALALRVEAAFTLLATKRSNDGWRPKGAPYALRAIGSGHASEGEPTLN